MNPNNCATCDHKKNPDGGHCYMFADEPTEVCMQHTLRKNVALVGRPHPSTTAQLLALLLSREYTQPADDESGTNGDGSQ